MVINGKYEDFMEIVGVMILVSISNLLTNTSISTRGQMRKADSSLLITT